MNGKYLDPKVVSFYIESSILRRLDDLCKLFKVNRSSLVNEFLDERLSYYEEINHLVEEEDDE